MNTKGKSKDYQDVIKTEDIKLILDRYHIGKKPLAKMLGWGETTIIRYVEGDVPSSEYSSKLQKLLEEPIYYYDMLVNRKDSLTGVAFRKSKKAVLSRIVSSKINAVAYYLIKKSNGEISSEFIQYLLYYCQAFNLSLNGKEIFQEEFIADNKEKPYSKVYKSLKTNGVKKLDVDDYDLTGDEMDVIDSVYYGFSWYGPRALQALIDYEKPFLRMSRDEYDNRIISKDTMKSYFRDVLYQYNIHDAGEIYKYPDRRLRSIKNKEI